MNYLKDFVLESKRHWKLSNVFYSAVPKCIAIYASSCLLNDLSYDQKLACGSQSHKIL